MMKTRYWLGTLALFALSAGGVSAQEYAEGELPEARIWLDRGDQPLLQRGDRVRVYYRTAADAYVAILHIDTDGTVQLLHPRAPEDDHYARAGRDYRLLFPQSSYWFVDEYPGKGYFFIVASPEPFDFSAFAYEPYERGWNLTAVGRTVYEDPYLAIDEYVARLIPEWETTPYALDFIAYDVGETHEYPRFLCYDCHGYRSYTAWNPYTYACTSFRVVIWDDPYFYPAYRYRGTRVVFAQPRRGVARFEFKERAAGETWSPLTRTRQPPLRRPAEYLEPTGATASPNGQWVPPRRNVAPSEPLRRATPSTRPAAPGTARPTTPLRRSDPAQGSRVLPPRTGTRAPSSQVVPPRTNTGRVTPPQRNTTPGRTVPATPRTGSDRPTLQRRPSAPSTRVRPPAKPGGGTGTVRPSSGGSRAVFPSRPSSGARPSVSRPSRPSTRAPTARPSTPSRTTRPAARPPRRPAAKPKKPGGGRPTAPPRRKPGGGGV